MLTTHLHVPTKVLSSLRFQTQRDTAANSKGKERDAETGNDDFGARYYSNRFGRWLSSDWSNVPVAVPYANLTNPQTLNLYAMASDDPESFADLDGHDDCCLENLFKTVDSFFSGVVKEAVNIALDIASAGIKSGNIHKESAADLIPRGKAENAPEAAGMITVDVGTALIPGGAEEGAGALIEANAAKGRAFEQTLVESTKATDANVAEQVTLKTQSGVKTKMDVVSTKQDGAIRLQEGKSSKTARLTKNQRAAHPEIEKSGATVAGKGKPGYPGGTNIPPTKVEVVRPRQ